MIAVPANVRPKAQIAIDLMKANLPSDVSEVDIDVLRNFLSKGQMIAIGNIYPRNGNVYDLSALKDKSERKSRWNSVPTKKIDVVQMAVTPMFRPQELQVPQIQQNKSAGGNISILNNSDLAYVPKRDVTFVPFGAFDDLNMIIRNYDPKEPCNVFIFGDSGSGKTISVEQACSRNNRKLVFLEVTEETSTDELIGHYQLVNGETQFVPGRATIAAQQGAVLLLDEIDRGSHKFYDALMKVITYRSITIEKTGEVIEPAPGFMVICTGNTLGRGDSTGRFTGARVINEAFLERIDVYLEQPFPTLAVEKKILSNFLDDGKLIQTLAQFAQQLRKTYTDGGIDNFISTRRLVMIAKRSKLFGVKKSLELCCARFGTETAQTIVKTFEYISDTVLESPEEIPTTFTADEIAVAF